MNRKLVVPVTVALIAGLLLAGIPLRERLLAERHAAGLTEGEVSELPPVGAASVLLLGGFRGVAVDVLWLRVLTLHEKREDVEERSLIDLITQMQPHFLSVWAFLAFDIAYDISVQYPDPADQWRWIQEAHAFLEKGIKLNPDSGELCFYMGYILKEKISQNPYFEDACERDLKVNNYEEAAKYFDRSRRLKIGMEFPFHRRLCDVNVFWCYLARAHQIFRRAELADNLTFSPATMREAQVFLDKCAAETVDVRKRWPTDDVIDTFPARMDLALCDGYMEHVNASLAGPDVTPEQIARARRLRDTALAEFAKTQAKYPDPHLGAVFKKRLGDAWTRIPVTIMKRAGELIPRTPAGPELWTNVLRLLRLAQAELDAVPAPLKKLDDVVVAQRELAGFRAVAHEQLRLESGQTPPAPRATSPDNP